jgi:hypothetical protein
MLERLAGAISDERYVSIFQALPTTKTSISDPYVTLFLQYLSPENLVLWVVATAEADFLRQ